MEKWNKYLFKFFNRTSVYTDWNYLIGKSDKETNIREQYRNMEFIYKIKEESQTVTITGIKDCPNVLNIPSFIIHTDGK